jgi:D-alanyl-D-alanine carboxypeptidase
MKVIRICAVFFSFCCLSSKAQDINRSMLTAFIDSVAENALKKGPAASVCVGVSKGAEVLVEKAYGFANLEWKTPATIHTVYLIRSVSKMFTATAIMQLAEKKKLSLDDRVDRWLDGFDSIKGAITVSQLLSHTSGIKNYGGEAWRNNFKSVSMTPQMWIDLEKSLPLDFTPGTGYNYSNTGYDMLALIVEKASGEKFTDYIKTHIADPAGLRETGHCPVQTVVSNRASAYEITQNKLCRADEWGNYGYGAANIHSSLDDLLLFGSALNHYTFLSTASIKQMQKAVVIDGLPVNYGLGTRIFSYPGHKGFGHTGSGGGWTSYLSYYPEDDLTIVLLMNSENDNDPQFPDAPAIGRQIEKKIFHLTNPKVKDLPVPENEIIKYTGQWLQPAITIYQINDRLWAKRSGADSTRLLYQGDNKFIPQADPQTILDFQMKDGKSELIAIYNQYSLVGFARRKR